MRGVRQSCDVGGGGQVARLIEEDQIAGGIRLDGEAADGSKVAVCRARGDALAGIRPEVLEAYLLDEDRDLQRRRQLLEPRDQIGAPL